MEYNREQIVQWAQEAMENTDVFLIDIAHSPARNHVRIIIDADLGVTADKCSLVNRYINRKLEESDPEHTLSLEVTSPGADKPLTHFRQYPKHIGRTIVITNKNGEIMKGKLKEINTETLTLESGTKKKVVLPIPFDEIEKSIIEISF